MKNLSVFVLLSFFVFNVFAQVQVNVSNDSTALANYLAGFGVSVTNASHTGATNQSGYFTGADTTKFPIFEGVVLTSGTAEGIIGPNDSGGYTGIIDSLGNLPGEGDILLDSIPGILGTNDACVLQFDIESSFQYYDTIAFNYVFGSEEYLEFVGSFNDVFAFFISGPNPDGGQYSNQNIALVPGTSDPVSVNTINDFYNPNFYISNGDGFSSPQNSDPNYIQYDGFTTTLEAKFAVIPNEVYHLKMAIADDIDSALDSGVFIEAGSIFARTSFPLTDASFEIEELENNQYNLIDNSTNEPIAWEWYVNNELVSTEQAPTLTLTEIENEVCLIAENTLNVDSFCQVISIDVVGQPLFDQQDLNVYFSGNQLVVDDLIFADNQKYISIYNLKGQLIFEDTIYSNSLTVNELMNGYYLVKIHDKNNLLFSDKVAYFR